MSRIRWFFLLFIVALSVTAVIAAWIGTAGALQTTYALLGTGLFATSLVSIWTGFYTQTPWRYEARITGHASLMLAAGVAFTGLGHDALERGVCPSFQPELHAWAMRSNFCPELAVASIVLGIWMGFPSAKLFFRRVYGRA